MTDDRAALSRLIMDALGNEPGQKAWGLAREINADKKLVNSVLFQELKGHVRQDREYRWYPIEVAAAEATETSEEAAPKAHSRIGKIASYYLDILAHDDSYDASVFAESRYQADYLELPSFPPRSIDELPPDETASIRTEINRIATQKKAGAGRKAPAIGYPVFAQYLKSKKGWEGFLLKPLFIFDVDEDDPAALQIQDINFPIVNRDVLSTLTGVRGGALMDELLALSHDLGMTDPQEMPEIDELFLRLQQIRPEWPWKESLDPDSTIADWPISAVKEQGLYNRTILLQIERSPYTKGLEVELQAFRRMSDEDIASTALSRAVGLTSNSSTVSPDNQPLLEVVPINTEQRHAVESAMQRPLTVITGPPGTGKSQVVTEIVVNAVWRNQRVLVASKNNKAVDVVEYRVNSFSTQPGIFRLGAKELNQRLADYLSTVLSANVDEEDRRALSTLQEQYQQQLTQLAEIADQRETLVNTRNSVDRLSREVETIRENLGEGLFARSVDADLETIAAYLNHALSAVQRLRKEHQPFLTRLFWGMVLDTRLNEARATVKALQPVLSYVVKDEQLPEVDEATAGVLHDRLTKLRSRVDEIKAAQEYHATVQTLLVLPSLETVTKREFEMQTKLQRIAAKLWSAWLQLLPERIDGQARSVLSQYSSVLKMLAGQGANDAGMGKLYGQFYDLSEKASPFLSAWAVTSLSAKGRIPFRDGVFDLVVIDEASQCDIASALPLLYRAKRAVIIGDPNQLRHISAVSEKLDRQLIMKHDLLEQPQLAYSVNSLYDLAAGAAGEGGVIALRDHHRSHGHIIQFSNERFYGGKLRVATKYELLKRVADNQPAVRWEHVRGRTVRPEAGSANNRDEAKRVVDEIMGILNTVGFDGTIGVVTPFRGQANLINVLLNEQEVSSSRVSGSELLVDTVHKFQGDERDVIIFSPVVSTDAPDSALRFLELNKHLFNVAITRARSTLIVVGDQLLADKLPETHVLRQFSEYVNNLDGQEAFAAEVAAVAPDAAEYPPVSRPELVSDWERTFYVSLRNAGVKPIPQYPVDQYLLDFAVITGNRKLAIEIDGERFHRDWDGELVVRDRLRNLRLIELGWEVMRFWVYEIRDHEAESVDRVREWLESNRGSELTE